MKFVIFVTMLASSSLSYAKMLDTFPLEMTCKAIGSNQPLVEVYNYFNMGTFIFAFKENGAVATLPGVKKSDAGFILNNHVFNANLTLTSEGMYKFSVYEAELNGNGKIVVSPTVVECMAGDT